jgi:antitoxin YefM
MYSISVQIRRFSLAIQTTYTKARQNLASLLDKVTTNREIVYIQRRRRENVAMITASELSSLLETAHLLRSPRNAQRLLLALHRAMGKKPSPMTLEELRREVGLEAEKR